jgi:hypothetical protein
MRNQALEGHQLGMQELTPVNMAVLADNFARKGFH